MADRWGRPITGSGRAGERVGGAELGVSGGVGPSGRRSDGPAGCVRAMHAGCAGGLGRCRVAGLGYGFGLPGLVGSARVG